MVAGILKPDDNLSLNLISAGAERIYHLMLNLLLSFRSKIIIIDPTPRSILHVENVLKNLGRKNTKEYDKNFRQTIN